MPDQPPPNPPATMQPIGTQISTDRPCATCGFNLFGQLIQREPHYNLIVARCPECGTIASLQEYPAMSKWVGRWKLLLTGIWIMIILGLLAATSASLFGFSLGGLNLATDELSDIIQAEHHQWANETHNTTGTNYWLIEAPWIETQLEPLIDRHGGILRLIDRHVFWSWAALCTLAFFWGALWSTALLGARRRSVFALMCVLVGLVFLVTFAASQSGGWNSSHNIANKRMFLPVHSITTTIVLAALGLGVWLGRKLARLLVCLTLPPRLRTPLGVLWTRDGLDLPKPRSY